MMVVTYRLDGKIETMKVAHFVEFEYRTRHLPVTVVNIDREKEKA